MGEASEEPGTGRGRNLLEGIGSWLMDRQMGLEGLQPEAEAGGGRRRCTLSFWGGSLVLLSGKDSVRLLHYRVYSMSLKVSLSLVLSTRDWARGLHTEPFPQPSFFFSHFLAQLPS